MWYHILFGGVTKIKNSLASIFRPGRNILIPAVAGLLLMLCAAHPAVAADDAQIHRDASRTSAHEGYRSSRWAEYRGDRFSVYLNKGFEAHMRNDLETAIELYTAATHIRRRNTYIAYANRGNIYASTGQYELAIADFSEVVKLKPKQVSGYISRGNIWLATGDQDKALADFTTAIEKKPKSAAAYICRGRLLCKAGSHEKAFEDFDRALALEKEDPNVIITMARFLATCPKDKFRDGARAVELCNKAIELTRKHEGLLRRQRYDVMTYQRLGLAPQFDTLAAAFAETGNFAEAVANQNKAISLLAAENSLQLMADFRSHLRTYEEEKPLRQ